MKLSSMRHSSAFFLAFTMLGLHSAAMEVKTAPQGSYNGKVRFNVGSAIVARPIARVNQVCEDFICIQDSHELPFFAIFDGNGGNQSAEYAQKNLHRKLHENCLGQGVKDFSDRCISQAFEETGKAINRLKKNKSGSTAVTVFFSYNEIDNADFMHIAHIGDSRAILALFDNTLEVIELTKSHLPDNEAEKERLASFKPKRKLSEDVHEIELPTKLQRNASNARKRLFADLANLQTTTSTMNEVQPTLGSFAILHGEKIVPCIAQVPIEIEQKPALEPEACGWELSTGLAVTRCFGHQNLTKKGLIFAPDISHLKVTAKHRFVLIMSDGVHNHISDVDAVTLVSKMLEANFNLSEIAMEVIMQAARNDKRNPRCNDATFASLKTGIKDDMSVIVLKLHVSN